MISCGFLNAYEGISKKNNSQFFRVQVLAVTVDGTYIPYTFFTTAEIYEQVKHLRPKTSMQLKCGLSNYGHLTVESVKIEQQQQEGK